MTTWKDLKQVRPRSYTKGRPAGKARVIYVHYTAGSEGPNSAEAGAAYDQRRTDGTSAHYYVDSNSVVQCIDTDDRSHTALYNANLTGIHYELCGTVQTRAKWLDAISRATIKNAARQIARDMKDKGIKNVRLVARQVRAGNGIAGHGDATKGWPEDGGTHTDPGNDFPWDVLQSDINSFLKPEVKPVSKYAGDMKKYPTYDKWYRTWGHGAQSAITLVTKTFPSYVKAQFARDSEQNTKIEAMQTGLSAMLLTIREQQEQIAELQAKVSPTEPPPIPDPPTTQ